LRSFGFEFVSDFDIRISDFVRWRLFDLAQDMLGAINFLKLIKEPAESHLTKSRIGLNRSQYQPGLFMDHGSSKFQVQSSKSPALSSSLSLER
jgi:hypothetical protein